MPEPDSVVMNRIPCPNCHGTGLVHFLGAPSDVPCFVCDEDGTLEWEAPRA